MPMAHPRFHGWVMGSSHPVGVAADWLAAAWGQNAAMAASSPAAAAAEAAAGAWLLELLDLPRAAGFGLTTGATMANAIALAAARGAVLARVGWDVEARGLFGAPEVAVVVGRGGAFQRLHGAAAARLRGRAGGAGPGGPRGADAGGARCARRWRGWRGRRSCWRRPGTSTPAPSIPWRRSRRRRGRRGPGCTWTGRSGSGRGRRRGSRTWPTGVEAADSWATDAHKWLQVPYDCGAVIVRDEAALRRAMSIAAAYLPASAARDPGDYTPELSRRAHGLALWAVIAALGRAGVAEMLERHCRVARAIAEGLAAVPGLEVLNEVVLNQVALATTAGDAATRALLGAGAGRGAVLSLHRRLAGAGDHPRLGRVGGGVGGRCRGDRRRHRRRLGAAAGGGGVRPAARAAGEAPARGVAKREGSLLGKRLMKQLLHQGASTILGLRVGPASRGKPRVPRGRWRDPLTPARLAKAGRKGRREGRG